MEAPVFATGECCLRPTAMMYRNLCAMDVEEICRANPVDGMVLLVGCDKTTPATLMGACSSEFYSCWQEGIACRAVENAISLNNFLSFFLHHLIPMISIVPPTQ